MGTTWVSSASNPLVWQRIHKHAWWVVAKMTWVVRMRRDSHCIVHLQTQRQLKIAMLDGQLLVLVGIRISTSILLLGTLHSTRMSNTSIPVTPGNMAWLAPITKNTTQFLGNTKCGCKIYPFWHLLGHPSNYQRHCHLPTLLPYPNPCFPLQRDSNFSMLLSSHDKCASTLK